MDNRRRRFYVGEGDHKGLLVMVGILILALIIIASGLFYFLANRDLENAAYRAHFDTLRNTMQMLLPWLVIVNVIGFTLVLVLALFLTHRIAGPAFHLIRDLRAIAAGDLTIHTKFRRHDRLRDVAAALTDATGKLRVRIADAKKGIQELESITGGNSDLKDAVENIARNLNQLKT